MKAYLYHANGAHYGEVPIPVPTGREVLVRVHACGLNRADLGMRKGTPHGRPMVDGAVLGSEWAGEVVALGPNASGVAIGQRVMASGRSAFAGYTVADCGQLLPIPAHMGFDEAATLPVALLTMHNAVVTAGGLKAGQAVLIQGASSGVGLMGMQIARLKGASLVIGSSTDKARRAMLPDWGAGLAVDTRDPGWVEQVLQATGGEGVDLIVDQISGSVANHNLAATRVKGRIVNVGRLGGLHADFNFDLHALRRIHYIGVTFRSRTAEEVRQLYRDLQDDIWAAVTARELRLPIASTFAFDDIDRAFELMAANRHFGKIVLTM